MRNRTSRAGKAVAGVAAGALVVLSAGPGAAAEPVAQASAQALQITIAGEDPAISGEFKVVHDGNKATSTGTRNPAIDTFSGQSFLQAGTLAQDAVAIVRDGRGLSAACAGLAGDGATLVSAGDGQCLSAGKNLNLSAATFEISDVEIVPGVGPGTPQQVEDAVNKALKELGDPRLVLDVGAIQSFCTADPDTATGDSELVDVAAFVEFNGERLTLVEFPVNPAPNTMIVTDASDVVQDINAAIRKQLKTGLNGALGDLAPGTGQVLTEISNQVIAQIAPELAPLEENVLSGTLNKQEFSNGGRAITVTALDLQVLPAAAEELDSSLLSAQVGRSSCGPNRVVTAVTQTPTPTPTTPTPTPTPDPPGPDPRVPTSVPAGTDGGSTSGTAAGIVGALALMSLAAAVAGYRRALSR